MYDELMKGLMATKATLETLQSNKKISNKKSTKKMPGT